MAQFTGWDGGATTWDRDWDGPGTETFWDRLPDVIGRGFRVIWGSVARVIQWQSPGRRVKW